MKGVKKVDPRTGEANLSARISTKPTLILLYYSIPLSILLLAVAIGYATHYLIGIAVFIVLFGLVLWGITAYTQRKAEKSFATLRRLHAEGDIETLRKEFNIEE